MFSFITDQANAVAKYQPQAINQKGDKLWFSYINGAGNAISAYYDFQTRSFKSVVKGVSMGRIKLPFATL